jgi:hypothetical protein
LGILDDSIPTIWPPDFTQPAYSICIAAVNLMIGA